MSDPLSPASQGGPAPNPDASPVGQSQSRASLDNRANVCRYQARVERNLQASRRCRVVEGNGNEELLFFWIGDWVCSARRIRSCLCAPA